MTFSSLSGWTVLNIRYKKKGQAMHVWSNIEACSCDHCCSGKAISTTHSECVSVTLAIQQATRMRHIVICGLFRSTKFFHIISQTTWSSGVEKKVPEHKLCVLNFSTNFIWKMIHSKKNLARCIMNIRVYRSLRKVPVILVGFLKKHEFSQI